MRAIACSYCIVRFRRFFSYRKGVRVREGQSGRSHGGDDVLGAGVSASGYDAWLRRDVELSARIEAIHRDSRGTRGVDRRKWKKTTAPDLVRRDFSALAADELWVADATCVPTLAGFLFFAVVVDVYSRRGVIHHSDRGSQFTSIAFGNRCRDAGVRLSMGSTGDCYDNALCEFLRHVGVRIDRSRDVPHAARGRVGDLRFHRGVLQQQAPPLAHRLPEPGGVRAPGRLGPHAGGGVNVAPADPRELWSAARRPGRVGAHHWRRSVSGNRPDQGRRDRKVYLFK